MKHPRRRRHLSVQMLLSILGTAAFVLITLSVITWFYTRGLLVQELTKKSKNKVGLASNRINQWFDTKRALFLAISERIRYQDKGPAFNAAFFKRMLKKYRSAGVESIYMGYADGRYCTGTGWVPPKGWDFTRRPWYQSALAAKGVVYTKPYMDARTKLPMITVAGPIYDQRGALLSVMSIDVLIEDIMRTVNAIKIGQRGRAYVVNREGLYISHYDPNKVLTGNIASSTDNALFHEFMGSAAHASAPLLENAQIFSRDDYVVASYIPQTSWYLFFHLPKDEVNRPLRTLTFILILGFCAALALLSAAIFYLSRRITRPVLELAEGAERVAQGDYTVTLGIASDDEIGYVTECFNEMTEGLRDREFIKATFGRYVSQDVMTDILDGNISLGGEKREISILFSDIRGFTSLSEGLDPMELVRLLNAYFTRMDRAISSEGGSINKYLGDGILAIFGAPQRLENSALAAVNSALEKISQLSRFNRAQGTDLKIGIGIHTGEAVVGNIGSEQRTEYAVIGEAVNLSDKIESMTRFYGYPLLISEPTAKKLPHDFALRLIDTIPVKALKRELPLYTPLVRKNLSESELAELTTVNDIMAKYVAQDFEAVIADITRQFPTPDRHLAYIAQKCRQHLRDGEI